jgi:hypothetical protein
MNHVLAATLISVETPYVVTFLESLVVLPARNKLTPVFGETVTLALDDVLETIIMVVPLEKATLEVVGIYNITFVFCV